jgi:hypothetical protein
LFHADGQTYMTKLIVTFRNFANAPEKIYRAELHLCRPVRWDKEGEGNGRMPEVYEMCCVNQMKKI